MLTNTKNFQYDITAGEWLKRAVETNFCSNLKYADVLNVKFDADVMQTTITHKATGTIILQDKSGLLYTDAYVLAH